MSRHLDNSAIIRQFFPGVFWRISLLVSPGPKWLITFCLQFLLQRPWLLAVDGTASILTVTSFSTRIQTRSLYLQKWGFIRPTVSMSLNVGFFLLFSGDRGRDLSNFDWRQPSWSFSRLRVPFLWSWSQGLRCGILDPPITKTSVSVMVRVDPSGSPFVEN